MKEQRGMDLTNLHSTPLFIKPKRHFKTAARRQMLSTSPGRWGQEIRDHLYKDYPELSDRDVQLDWIARNDETGHALGNLIVDQKVAFPVFIEERKMAPLDIFIHKGHPYFPTVPRLKQALFRTDLFEGPITPREERTLMTDTPLTDQTQVNQWREGRRMYAADLEKDEAFLKSCFEKLGMHYTLDDTRFDFSILDIVLPTVTRQDLDKFASELETNPDLIATFTDNGHEDTILRILRQEPLSTEKYAEQLLSQLPVSVAHFQRSEDNHVVMKLASDAGYATQEANLLPEAFITKLSQLGIQDIESALLKASSDEGFTVTLRKHGNRSSYYLSDIHEAPEVKSFGYFMVKDASGEDHRGWVFPKVYDFEKNDTGQMLFVGDRTRVLQDKIAGVSIHPSQENLSPKTEVPKVDDIGCFCLSGVGMGLALAPIKVASVEFEPPRKGEDRRLKITGQDLSGQHVVFYHSKTARDLLPVPGEPNAYLLPETFDYFSLNGRIDTTLLRDTKKLTKMAIAEEAGNTFCRVRSISGGRAFLFDGPIAQRVEEDGVEQRRGEAIFKLACFGLSAEDAEKAIQKATEDGEVVLGDLRPMELLRDKVSMDRQAAALQTLATLPSLRKDTVKEAAELSKDPESMDRILALNFIVPQNLSVLVDHTDDFNKTSSRLSEMLIAARLGAGKDLPEDAIIGARKNLDDVLEGLAHLKSRLGPQTRMVEEGGKEYAG